MNLLALLLVTSDTILPMYLDSSSLPGKILLGILKDILAPAVTKAYLETASIIYLPDLWRNLYNLLYSC